MREGEGAKAAGGTSQASQAAIEKLRRSGVILSGADDIPEIVDSAGRYQEPSLWDFLRNAQREIALTYGDNSWSLAFWNVFAQGYIDAGIAVSDRKYGEAAIAGVFAAVPGPKALSKALNAARAITRGHHPLPRFLGGTAKQLLSWLDPKIHGEFHGLLRENLKRAGIPLRVGGRRGSAADWARYMNANPGAQRKAFDAVLDAARSMDARHGTSITQDVWYNVMNDNFTPFP